jgi:hypothetical protein
VLAGSLFQATKESSSGRIAKRCDGNDLSVFPLAMTLLVYPRPKRSKERDKGDSSNDTDDNFSDTR